MPGIFDLLARDGFGLIGTVGFFVPAALLIVIVVGAVVRDRRLAAREAAAEAYETGLERDSEGSPVSPEPPSGARHRGSVRLDGALPRRP